MLKFFFKNMCGGMCVQSLCQKAETGISQALSGQLALPFGKLQPSGDLVLKWGLPQENP